MVNEYNPIVKCIMDMREDFFEDQYQQVELAEFYTEMTDEDHEIGDTIASPEFAPGMLVWSTIKKLKFKRGDKKISMFEAYPLVNEGIIRKLLDNLDFKREVEREKLNGMNQMLTKGLAEMSDADEVDKDSLAQMKMLQQALERISEELQDNKEIVVLYAPKDDYHKGFNTLLEAVKILYKDAVSRKSSERYIVETILMSSPYLRDNKLYEEITNGVS